METPEKLPKISQKAPYKVELKAGEKYSWCSCGLTKTEPFCDGSHKFAETELKSVKIYPEETKTYYLCGCKHAKDGSPFCDGAHNKL